MSGYREVAMDSGYISEPDDYEPETAELTLSAEQADALYEHLMAAYSDSVDTDDDGRMHSYLDPNLIEIIDSLRQAAPWIDARERAEMESLYLPDGWSDDPDEPATGHADRSGEPPF